LSCDFGFVFVFVVDLVKYSLMSFSSPWVVVLRLLLLIVVVLLLVSWRGCLVVEPLASLCVGVVALLIAVDSVGVTLG